MKTNTHQKFSPSFNLGITKWTTRPSRSTHGNAPVLEHYFCDWSIISRGHTDLQYLGSQHKLLITRNHWQVSNIVPLWHHTHSTINEGMSRLCGINFTSNPVNIDTSRLFVLLTIPRIMFSVNRWHKKFSSPRFQYHLILYGVLFL